MLSTLAKIASQLEKDHHFEMADQVDEIITAIANRDSDRYEEGELWDALTDVGEANVEEELEESGLEVQEGPEGLGMTDDETYSSILADHQGAIRAYLANSDELKEMVADAGSHGLPPIVSNSWVEQMVDHLRAIFDELAARGNRRVKYDPEAFDEEARLLIQEVAQAALEKAKRERGFGD